MSTRSPLLALFASLALAHCTGASSPDAADSDVIDDLATDIATDTPPDATSDVASLCPLVDAAPLPPCDASVFAQPDAASDGGVRVPGDTPFNTLAEYGFFTGNGATQQPVAGVIPYDVNTPLFADYASKNRFMYVPPGATIGFVANGVWTMPYGSVLIKTFYFPVATGVQLVETRLLIQQCTRIRLLSYLWAPTQDSATRSALSAAVPVNWTDADGGTHAEGFVTPGEANCGQCHGPGDATHVDRPSPLGIRTGQMNRDFDYGAGPENQISHLVALGLLTGVPSTDPSTLERFSDPFGTDAVESRARSYFQGNCAHCHSPTACARDSSGLQLQIENMNPATLGICKTPLMSEGAGLAYDIVPGFPDVSFLSYRMALSADAGTVTTALMPPLGRTVDHAEAVALIGQWIGGLPAASCTPDM